MNNKTISFIFKNNKIILMNDNGINKTVIGNIISTNKDSISINVKEINEAIKYLDNNYTENIGNIGTISKYIKYH
jgi:hypothetical protein